METSKSPGSSPQPQVKSRRPKRWQFGLLALLGKEELDVTVQLQNVFVKTPEQLRQLSLYSARIPQTTAPTSGNTSATTSTTTPTTAGGQLQLADVATVKETIGPGVINHVDLERSTTLTVSLTPAAPLGQLVPNSHQNFG
jgi:hydrophobic/amphiphilic exporter-1 (mainly G- bacteria), HAE1 family